MFCRNRGWVSCVRLLFPTQTYRRPDCVHAIKDLTWLTTVKCLIRICSLSRLTHLDAYERPTKVLSTRGFWIFHNVFSIFSLTKLLGESRTKNVTTTVVKDMCHSQDRNFRVKIEISIEYPVYESGERLWHTSVQHDEKGLSSVYDIKIVCTEISNISS